MVIKIIGGVLVVLACSAAGYLYSARFFQRVQDLRLLQSYFSILENEMNFACNPLIEAFERICSNASSGVTAFFNATIGHLRQNDGMSAGDAWEKAVKENCMKTALNREDEAILLSFGKLLGSTDLDGQIRNIRHTVEQIRGQGQKAEDARSKNEKMFRSLGLLGGLAIVILLF